MRLSGKVAVVVPGTYGVGYDTAVRFAREGARGVLVGGLDDDNGEKTVAAIERAGGAGAYRRTDILEEGDVEALVKDAIGRWGGVDVAFGCPDYYVNGLAIHQSADLLDATLAYNCRSLFFLAKHVLPHMASRAQGSLIFLSSVYANVSGSASCAYEVSKGAVLQMARSFGERYAAARVRVNSICVGHVAGGPDGVRDELPTYAVRDAAEIDRLSRFYPIGRLALGEDVAGAAAFLASDDAAYVAGSALQVEGGFVTR